MPDANGVLVAGDPGYNQPVGLINTTPTTEQTNAAKPAAFTVAPNQTVASNVEGIVAKDSPLMQQAASRAAEKMNARGLLNSTQAISAGQSAVYDAALPIAQADAATYDRAATNTTQAQNTQANVQQVANVNTSQVLPAATAAQQSTLVKQGEIQTALTKLQGTQAVELQQVANDNRTLLQTSAAATSAFTTAANEIAQINQNAQMTPEAKTAAIAQATQLLRANITLAGTIANLDLGSLLTF